MGTKKTREEEILLSGFKMKKKTRCNPYTLFKIFWFNLKIILCRFHFVFTFKYSVSSPGLLLRRYPSPGYSQRAMCRGCGRGSARGDSSHTHFLLIVFRRLHSQMLLFFLIFSFSLLSYKILLIVFLCLLFFFCTLFYFFKRTTFLFASNKKL